ncbi:WecB/TagA/CpsF family glycosyltransferase [Polynucleobacter sp. AP-Elch-400A-B2]|uniref:WecB/TagA/CpsF family glycosyltransferase n=1 Tax=Polynucleobacter sp. AP-Elch-400A-B2 TaxID=2576930 RepID=UPI002040BE1A|nr:WecB/TagA/CpsF family glycosyltransferase [Polynucleobacter sp. AP-Elch-400A-B2]
MACSITQVARWGQAHESRAINFCNVHSIITASESVEFSQALNRGDLNLPDGAPIAGFVKKKYGVKQRRISGPDFMVEYFHAAKKWHEKIYLYGNTESVLKKLIQKIHKDFPWIEIVGHYAPPYCAVAQQEENKWIAEINNSKANTLWVSLGCPKQELWLALHKDKINCAMLAVGAAFPLIAGEIPRAPQWMREHSLEWAYRLYREPRRLIGRYFYTNLCFLLFILKDYFAQSK